MSRPEASRGAASRAVVAPLVSFVTSGCGFVAGSAATVGVIRAIDPLNGFAGPGVALRPAVVAIAAFVLGLGLTRCFRVWAGWLILFALVASVVWAVVFTWLILTWDGISLGNGGCFAGC